MTLPNPAPISLDANEQQRLAELQRLLVMDSGEETAFNDLIRMAADLLGTPIALISLVDDSRQWFKARVGLQAQETPREYAFCAHAIESPGEVMVVNDASADQRFANNPLVLGDPNIRFYAGAPLITNGGEAIGTLCIIDTRPREIAASDMETLQFMARQVMALLERRALELQGPAA